MNHQLFFKHFKPFFFSFHYTCKLFRSLNSSHTSTIMETRDRKDWRIFSDSEKYQFNFGSYAILILNRPIKIRPNEMSDLWNKACWRMTVDGGTDRWFDFVEKNSLSLPLPNYVTGDFDSVRPKTLDFCKQREEITIKNTPDQNYTDFHKALQILTETCPYKLDCFLVISEHSGRLDQTFSNLNTLSKTPLHGFMLTHSAVTWLLDSGPHRIYIPDYLLNKNEFCGILPFSNRAKVSTKGLKWNLDDDYIQFGALISSSNTFDGNPVVELNTDNLVIWTMSYGNSDE